MLNRDQRRCAALCILPIALSAVALMAPAGTARKPMTHTVTIDGTRFQPQTVTLEPGDSVVWVNKDPFPHTATSTAAGFDSHAIAPGGTFKYTAKKRGDFSYICTIHQTMTGTLHVQPK